MSFNCVSILNDNKNISNRINIYDFIHNNTNTPNNTEICHLLICSDLSSNLSILNFNYCVLDNRQYITWPLIVIVVLLCFYFLSTSVDEYVSRILGRMSVKL